MTLRAAFVVGADHDAVGILEVADRGALAQEFRVRDDRDVGRRIGLADQPLDFVAGADRHRRFGDDDRKALRDAAAISRAAA